MPIITYIVPVYMIDLAVLDRCLRSIIKTDMDYECILIIDGDGQAEIYQKFVQSKYENIKIVATTHVGVNHARNEGLRLAQGEWVCFCDADDEVDANGIKRSLQNVDYNVKIILGNYIEKFHAGSLKCKLYDVNGKMGKKYALNNLINCRYNMGMVWAKLFRREYLLSHSLFLNENLSFAEDCEYVLRCICELPDNGIVVSKENFYAYYRNVNSVTKRFDSKYLTKYTTSFDCMINDLNIYNIQKLNFDVFVAHVLIQVTSSYVFNFNADKEERKRFTEVLNTKYFAEAIQNVNVKNFSLARGIVFLCWKIKAFYLLKAIAYFRQM